MCKPASFIIVNGQPPKWSVNTENHTGIRKEHGVPENTDTLTASVQVEITPPDGDLQNPIKDWIFKVNQDRLPKWWDASEAEVAVRVELKKWAAKKLIKKDIDVISEGQFYLCGGNISAVRGGTISAVWDGQIIVYTRTDPNILKTSQAVMIDRCKKNIVVYIGADK